MPPPFALECAICPSCGGRRMAERAAHLVDDVFPIVPVRQWVLSLLVCWTILGKGAPPIPGGKRRP